MSDENTCGDVELSSTRTLNLLVIYMKHPKKLLYSILLF